jgi:glycosyltransferase involved in cell wall biosynthesis
VPRLLLLAPGELTRDPRARRAARAAFEAGYDVVGVSGSRPGETPAVLEGAAITRVGGLRPRAALGSGSRTTRLPRTIERELRGCVRIGRLIALNLRLARVARGLARPDVVHANDFDTLLAGWLATLRTGARLVYDAHEIYADQEPDAPKTYRGLVRALEGPLARRADVLVTVSDPIGEELRHSLRVSSEPIVVLNCPARSESDLVPRGAGPLRAVYQGAMGPGRPLGDLLDAAATSANVHLTIRVANADLAALREEVARRGLAGRVAVVDPVSPDRLVEALSGFHVGLVINRPVTRNDELALPNKLFEYLMAGLAVIVPRLPGMAPLVKEEAVGLTYEPARPADLASALTRLATDAPRLGAMRRRARRLALDRYNAEVQAEKLLTAWQGGNS